MVGLRQIVQAVVHALGDDLAHSLQRDYGFPLARFQRRGRGCLRRGGGRLGGEHIAFDDQAIGAGTGHGGNIDALALGGHARAGGCEYAAVRSGCGGFLGGRGFPGGITGGEYSVDIRTGGADVGDGFGDRHHIALFIEELQHGAGGGGIHGDGELIGLHFEHGIAFLDFVAFAYQPFGDDALGHLQPLLGHDDLMHIGGQRTSRLRGRLGGILRSGRGGRIAV